jgi:hypothetical protein
MSRVTKETKTPSFTLPNVKKVFQWVREDDYMIKLDLSNGFFHIPLHPTASEQMGIKCGNKFYKLMRLPQGLCTSPYIMQRTMYKIFQTLVKPFDVKLLLYLDDLLIIGPIKDLEMAREVLLSSSLKFNMAKCELIPTKRLRYLGINIDIERKCMSITKAIHDKIVQEFDFVQNKTVTLRYKQRLAGLINFVSPILKLPQCLTNLAYKYHHCLHNFKCYFHTNEVFYYKDVSGPLIFTDATPEQFAVVNNVNSEVLIARCPLPILEAEYIAVWLAHALSPKSIIMTDNMAAAYLFRKGKLPPKWRNSYRMTCALAAIYKDPIIEFVPTAENKADVFSRIPIQREETREIG